MLVQKAQNASALTFTVSSTDVGLFEAMNTAGGTPGLFNAGFPSDVNAVEVKIENGDIRYSDDGNAPTASNGMLGVSGEKLILPHYKLEQLRFIAVDTDVTLSVRVGKAQPGDSSAVSMGGSASKDNEDLISSAVTHADVTLATADTEGTYTLPNAIKGFEFRLLDDATGNCLYDTKLCYGGNTGDSATNYIPVEDGELYWRGTLALPAGYVLRFQSPTANQTIKIVTYN